MTMRQLLSAGLMTVVLVAVLAVRYQRHRHPSRQQCVLQVFLDRPNQRLYGLDVNRLSGLSPGSIYPELAWLERRQWIGSGWEEVPSTPHGPRRLYWLNPDRPSKEPL